MKNSNDIAKRVVKWVGQYTPMTEDEKIIFVYGVELIFETVTKLGLICLAGMMVGYGMETVIAMFSFCILRFFAGGFHCRSNLGCTTAMILICLSSIFCNELVYLNGVSVFFLYSVDVALILLYAPRDGAENKIMDSIRRRNNKIWALVVLSVFYILSLGGLELYKEIIVISATLECFSLILKSKGEIQNEKESVRTEYTVD